MSSLGGATIWARKTLESDVFYRKPAEWFKVWFYIVAKVNYGDTKHFPRGSNYFTYRQISDDTRTTRDQVDKFVRWAREQSMLATRKTTRGFVISIAKYDKYQDLDNYGSDTKSETEAKQKRNRSDTIKEEDKEDKEITTNNKRAVAASPPGVQEVMKAFYSQVNPGLNFGNKTQREAAAFLVNRFGLDPVLDLVGVLRTTNGQPYAPVITTPLALKEKMAQLQAFISKESNRDNQRPKTIKL